jgi:hypothetical protein
VGAESLPKYDKCRHARRTSDTKRLRARLAERSDGLKFGYGIIAEIKGNKLEIDFEKAARKRVLGRFGSIG